MTHRNYTAACLAAGLASLIAAPAVHAAKPLNAQQKQAMAEAVKEHHRQYALPQPQTMEQAEATEVRLPDGSVSAQVPTELWNHLSVYRDANGVLRVREQEGHAAPASIAREDNHD